MTRRTVTLRSQAERDRVAIWARNAETGTTVEFRQARRNGDQNSLMWVLLGHVSRQVEWYGQHLSADDWKDVLTASYRQCRVVPGVNPGTFVPLGMRTSEMTKGEFAELIDLIYAFGAERGVDFDADARRAA